MDFTQAFHEMRENDRLATREAWGEASEVWVAAQWPDEHSKMRRPYLYARGADGGLVPYSLSNEDLFAMDWRVVP